MVLTCDLDMDDLFAATFLLLVLLLAGCQFATQIPLAEHLLM